MSLESSGPLAAPAPGQLDQPGLAALDNSPVVYGLGFFGLTSTAQALAGYFLFFYVDVLGLAVALAAIVNVIYAIWDAVNDPLVGYLSDNTRSRWGRRRPWLLAGLPFYLFLASVIAGAGLGGVKVCREMILATLVDRSLARTGRRQEGVYYSLSRFFGRLSKLLEALALILLGLLFGYVSGADPGPNPESAFRFLMSVLPFICMLAALLLARSLRLEEDKSLAQA